MTDCLRRLAGLDLVCAAGLFVAPGCVFDGRVLVPGEAFPGCQQRAGQIFTVLLPQLTCYHCALASAAGSRGSWVADRTRRCPRKARL